MENKLTNEEKMSLIWNEKKFYVRLKNLNRFDRWQTYESKLVINFYEMESGVYETKEYISMSKKNAYQAFINEYEYLISK